MDELYSFAARSLPKDILIPSLIVIGLSVFIMAWFRIWRWRKILLWTILIEYILLILWSTVIGRNGIVVSTCKLMPYWNWDEIVSGRDPLDVAEIVLNVVLFVPLGMLLTGICGRWAIWKLAMTGCMMSVMIEALQLWMRCGLCETNDVIHNTLGCAIGALLVRGVSKCLLNKK